MREAEVLNFNDQNIALNKALLLAIKYVLGSTGDFSALNGVDGNLWNLMQTTSEHGVRGKLRVPLLDFCLPDDG